MLINIKTCDISNFDNVELKLNGRETLLLVSLIFKLLMTYCYTYFINFIYPTIRMIPSRKLAATSLAKPLCHNDQPYSRSTPDVA